MTEALHRIESLHVHPSVLFQLGRDLITDEVQALIELVKNSFDADARSVSVTVVTEPELVSEAGKKTLPRPWLSVSDDGRGMTPDEIVAGWLTVSNSWKRDFKAQGKVTAAGRTPLGDKGLGRLGTQRLGGRVVINTRPFGSNQTYKVVLPWARFAEAPTLDSVDLEIVESDSPRDKPGTNIVIDYLSEGFLALASPERLSQAMSQMISPFEPIRDFKLKVQLNGVPLDLTVLPKKLRDAAEVSYRIDYQDESLRIFPRLDSRLLQPNNPTDIDLYDRWIRPDNGKSFGAWLAANDEKRLREFGVRVGSGSRLIAGEVEVAAADIPNVAFDSDGMVDPGPFSGEIDALDLDEDRTGAFVGRSEYKAYVRSIGGIRVYRDGFAVRTDKDWLGLSKRASSGRSFYGIRPGTEIGYINISARDNALLAETTNREGFQRTPALASFRAINEYWLGYADRLQSFVRRRYLDYVKELAKEDSAATAESPQQAADHLSSIVASSEEVQELGASSRSQLEEAEGIVRRSIDDLAVGQDDKADERDARFREVLATVLALIGDASSKLARVDAFIKQVVEAGHDVDMVVESMNVAKQQLADAWDMVAVGLAAEGIVHELRQVVNGIATRTSTIRTSLRDKKALDVATSTYLEHVSESMKALLKQAAHIDPGLRYMRESRKDLDLQKFALEYRDFYASTWTGPHEPSFEVNVRSDGNVVISRGRLTQVLDNLVLNSRYWVAAQVKRGGLPGSIVLTVDGRRLLYRDDGPGISPAVESSLFDPFVTLKPQGEGRGLGLFVVRQLLESESATITLGPDRDPDGRFRQFTIDLDPSGQQ